MNSATRYMANPPKPKADFSGPPLRLGLRPTSRVKIFRPLAPTEHHLRFRIRSQGPPLNDEAVAAAGWQVQFPGPPIEIRGPREVWDSAQTCRIGKASSGTCHNRSLGRCPEEAGQTLCGCWKWILGNVVDAERCGVVGTCYF